MKIHFCGVGKMGLPMAGHLAAAGHELTVGDPSAERLALARAQGLTVAEDERQAMAAAHVVFSSLPNDGALRTVAAVLAGAARPGTTYVDTSTVSPQASAQVAQSSARSPVR